MATTSRIKKTNSAQQWAWEFLRRNPNYRDAFLKLDALSPEQLAYIVMSDDEDEGRQIDEMLICALDVQFFDTSQMTGFKDTQKTVGDYIDQSQKLRDLLNESEVQLFVDKKFRLKTYSLTRWCDPKVEYSASEVAGIWNHEIPLDFGVVHAPEADGLNTLEQICERTGWHGWPTRPTDTMPSKKPDKRLRKSTVHTTVGGAEVYRGIDDRTFLPSGERWLALNQTQVCATFDLSLPIEFQLNHVKALLEQHQDSLVKGGIVQRIPKQVDRFGTFAEYLEILDMLDDGHTHLNIAKKIDGVTTINDWKLVHKANKLVQVQRVVGRSKRPAPINELTQAVRKKIERAVHLRDHGYRALAFSG
jgi:hypothetical protein